MFLLVSKYLVPLEEVDARLPEHRVFLDRFYREGKFVFSGPREPRTGGVILVNVDTELEAMKIVVEDPFFSEKIADYDVIRFTPTKHDPRFAPFLAGAGAAAG